MQDGHAWNLENQENQGQQGNDSKIIPIADIRLIGMVTCRVAEDGRKVSKRSFEKRSCKL